MGFISHFGLPTVRNVRKISKGSYILSKYLTSSTVDMTGLNFGSTVNNQIAVISTEVLYLVILFVVGSVGLFSDQAVRTLFAGPIVDFSHDL